MPSSPAERAEQQRIRRLREKMRLAAEFSGATTIPVAWFGHDKHGEFFAIGIDGKRIDCTPIPTAPANGTPESAPVAPQVTNEHHVPLSRKKFYAPKAMPRETYEKNVMLIRKGNGTKAQVHKEIGDTPDKGGKQFLALVDALPDGPDWYMHFPLYRDEE